MEEYKIELDLVDVRFMRDILEEATDMSEVQELVYSIFKEYNVPINQEYLEILFGGYMEEKYDFVSLNGVVSFFEKYNNTFRFYPNMFKDG